MYEDAEEQSNWNTEIACNKVGNWFSVGHVNEYYAVHFSY